MLTRAEAAALYEALRGILGEARAKEFWVDVVVDNPHLDPEIGSAHDATPAHDRGLVARPRSVEP